MSNSAHLEQRIADALAARRVQFQSKKMMGGVAFMVNEKMCVGTVKQLLMVRFDPERHEEMLARPGAGPMDFTGKPMRGYVFVRSEAIQTDTALAYWMDAALAFNPMARRSAKRKPAQRRQSTKRASK